ncbi:FecR domain-containing protein [Stieleria sp. TO1_6]|uniref:LamG-like jellyroll fold domain-containing protein n=1 Tax=Stieleria tagensis TaxID=2956795 RepID=UPI00209AF4B0|nr:LamG-like jellyroll fold domain-containing protein [Stieleria tagensis]MCO8124539.1 FecR domain-containing protein [Stieleria tagensis]
MTEEEKNDLESLLMELTEGELSPEQSHRLASVIRQHPAARQLHLEYCQVHTMLAWEHGVLRDLQLPDLSDAPDPPSDFLSFWKPLAVAAALVLAGVILWPRWGARSRMKPGETVASLTRSVAASLELFGASSEFNMGSEVRTGSYQLDQGLVQITFESGVEVIIEAPASFEIHGPEFMSLNEGRLAANVTSEGVGFTVETPDAEVVVFGTEFAIEVVGQRSSEVHVFKGEVEVQPRRRDTSIEPVRLVTNQATRIDHSTLIPLGISLDHQRFLRSLNEPEPTYSGNVRELLPLVYYRMAVIDDGHTLKDATKGHGNTASVVKGDTRRQPFAPGRIGSSLRLDGPRAGGYAQISSGLKLPTAEFTIMAWIRTETLPRNAVLVSDMNLSGDETFRFGLVGDHGHLGLTLADETRFLTIVDPSPLPLEDWTHVAVVKTTDGLRLYRNGALVASEPLNGFQAQPHNRFSIGGTPKEYDGKKRDRRSGFWHGRIDELAFFGSALTSEQIDNLFQLTPQV